MLLKLEKCISFGIVTEIINRPMLGLLVVIPMVLAAQGCNKNQDSQVSNGIIECVDAIPVEQNKLMTIDHGGAKLIITSDVKPMEGNSTELFDLARVYSFRQNRYRRHDFTVSTNGKGKINIKAKNGRFAMTFDNRITFLRNGKQETIPGMPFLTALKINDESFDSGMLELAATTWYDSHFEDMVFVHTISERKMIGGICPLGFNPAMIIPSASNFLPEGFSGLYQRNTGACHAVASSTVASLILGRKGLIGDQQRIHPSYFGLEYWTNYRGNTIEEFINSEVASIEISRKYLLPRLQRLSPEKIKEKLTHLVDLAVKDEQGGIPLADIALINRTNNLPLVDNDSLSYESFDGFSVLTQDLIRARSELILSDIPPAQLSEHLRPLVRKIFAEKERLAANARSLNLGDNPLKIEEIKFSNNPQNRRQFLAALDQNPLIAGFSGHAITVYGVSNDGKILVYNSGSIINRLIPMEPDKFFSRLKLFYVVE